MENVRWGVLSTAKIGTEFVIPATQAAEGCEVVAIASRSLDSAEQVASDFGIEKAYGSYGQLLLDPDIDAVYIPLPNHMHARWSITAAENGKHVLCEKPIALSSAEAETMAAAAESAGVILREAFMYQFQPAWQKALQLVGEGRIGDIKAIESWFSFYNDDATNIRNVLDYGGGALMDIGCYCVHLSRLFLGNEPTALKATVRRDPESGVDIATAAILEFGDAIASFSCSIRSEPSQRVDIHGSEGRINVQIPINTPSDRKTRISVYAGGNPPADPDVEVIEFDPMNQYTLQAEAFAAAIRNDAPLPDSGRDIVHNIRTIEKIFAATGPSGWS